MSSAPKITACAHPRSSGAMSDHDGYMQFACKPFLREHPLGRGPTALQRRSDPTGYVSSILRKPRCWWQEAGTKARCKAHQKLGVFPGAVLLETRPLSRVSSSSHHGQICDADLPSLSVDSEDLQLQLFANPRTPRRLDKLRDRNGLLFRLSSILSSTSHMQVSNTRCSSTQYCWKRPRVASGEKDVWQGFEGG